MKRSASGNASGLDEKQQSARSVDSLPMLVRPVAICAIALAPLFLTGGTGCAGEEDGKVCTLIGCGPELAVRVVGLPAQVSRPGLRLEGCVDGVCRRRGVPRGETPGVSFRSGRPKLTSTRRVPVSVILRDGRGRVISAAHGTIRPHRSEPNGPGCGGGCFTARATFRTDTGVLRPWLR